jgi:hypothetical protein
VPELVAQLPELVAQLPELVAQLPELVAQLPELVAQFCNPSYWEARTWDGLRSAGPRDCGIQ